MLNDVNTSGLMIHVSLMPCTVRPLLNANIHNLFQTALIISYIFHLYPTHVIHCDLKTRFYACYLTPFLFLCFVSYIMLHIAEYTSVWSFFVS